MFAVSSGTYTQTGITDTINLDLPEGDYYIEYDWYNSDANDGWVSLAFSGELLVDELRINDYEYFTISDTFEDIVVEANSSKDVEWTINIPQLADFDNNLDNYMYTLMELYRNGTKRILERYGSQKHVRDTLVAMIDIRPESELTFAPDDVKFVDAHVGTQTYATLTIENTGCMPYIINEDFEIVVGQYFQLLNITGDYEYNNNYGGYYLNPGASIKFFFSFYSDYKTGTFRDAFKLQTNSPFTGPETIVIPLAATATSTPY